MVKPLMDDEGESAIIIINMDEAMGRDTADESHVVCLPSVFYPECSV
jgi:hypothetical protein